MLDLAIVIILILGFFMGLRRGFILQLFHLTGFIAAFIAAKLYYEELAPKLHLWIPYPNIGEGTALQMLTDSSSAETAYYRAIAYVIIFLAVKFLWQLVGSLLNFIAQLPILKQLNVWAGGILGIIEVYIILFILAYIAALLPIESVQTALKDSVLVEMIVNNTPILSDYIEDLWFKYVTA